jgi:hypothetical protein
VARFSERNPARGSLKQRNAVALFQLTDCLADGRWRDAEEPRRGRETVGFGNRQKRRDAIQGVFQIMNPRFSVYVRPATL